MVWNRLSSAKLHRVLQGMAVPRHYRLGAGPDESRPDDWVVVRDAHPALISRILFQAARSRRESRRLDPTQYSYRTGHGARSPFLLTGLVHCLQCGHTWQGYSITKGWRCWSSTAGRSRRS